VGKRTNRQTLEMQSDRIEAVLAQHKVAAQVTGGCVSPKWIRFQVKPAIGARMNKIRGLTEELALALGSDSCRVSRQGSLVSVEIPRTDPRPVRLLPLFRRLEENDEIPFGTALLGLADDGVPLLVRLPSPEVAHILIAGTTGSGKSALARTIVASLALSHRPSQIGFVLIDPKRRAFGPAGGLPHLLRPVLSDADEIEHTLAGLVELMLRRDRDGCAPVSARHNGEPRVVVVIDELVDLLMVSDGNTRDAITRLSQRGREAGIHIIACTQKPASQVIGGLAKANFPLRLVGRVTSPEDAKVASGYAQTGAEQLSGPGDFLAVSGGRAKRFQAAYVSSQDLAVIVGEMLGPGPSHCANTRPNGRSATGAPGAHSGWWRIRKTADDLRGRLLTAGRDRVQ
jgi:S-DNA-T family DNA segregation ATPase FtsK/SpoIIIE